MCTVFKDSTVLQGQGKALLDFYNDQPLTDVVMRQAASRSLSHTQKAFAGCVNRHNAHLLSGLLAAPCLALLSAALLAAALISPTCEDASTSVCAAWTRADTSVAATMGGH